MISVDPVAIAVPVSWFVQTDQDGFAFVLSYYAVQGAGT